MICRVVDLMAAIAWHIWIARNNVIFNDKIFRNNQQLSQ